MEPSSKAPARPVAIAEVTGEDGQIEICAPGEEELNAYLV